MAGFSHTGMWPLSWRVAILLNISIYNMLGNVFAAGISPLLPLLAEEFSVSTQTASLQTSYAVLALGVSNILAPPFCHFFGKRYTILVSMAIFLGGNIWTSVAVSYSSLTASRIVAGLAGGMIEAMGPQIVSELFMEQYLARAMVVYIGALAAGSAIGPVIAGAMATRVGDWRWFFRVVSILIGANLLTSILMLPETTTEGNQPPNLGGTIRTGLPAPKSELEIESKGNEIEDVTPPNSLATTGNEPDLWGTWYTNSFFNPFVYFRTNWSTSSLSSICSLIIRPFALLFAPAVLVTTLVFGCTIGWTVLLSVVLSNVWQAPPRLWTAEAVGLLNLAPFTGLAVGLIVGGPVADMLSIRSARRTRAHSPRSRLPVILLGGLISPAGLLAIGLTLGRIGELGNGWAGSAVGWGMLSFGLTASANVLLAYCVDVFGGFATDIGVLVNVVKNCIGFGVSFASMDWFTASGAKAQMGVMAAVLWGIYLLVIPLYFYEKRMTEIGFKATTLFRR